MSEERAFNTNLPFQRVMSSKIMVRFMIDKEKKRVAFAEAKSDFIDVLFSFLTLPLGTIVRLLDKQTGLGSLDNVYQSVEQLDDMDLETDECKKMLLNPRSAAAIICEDLKIENIHEANPRNFYLCKESDCLTQSKCYYTYVADAPCNNCGKQMNERWSWPNKKSDKGGIFIYERQNDFLITDDLRVMSISAFQGVCLLRELHFTDLSILEEKIIYFGTKEVLNLLRLSLVSKNPLTEFCLGDVIAQASKKCSLTIKEETNDNESKNEITLKLIFNKKNNNVLSAQVGEDFINQLLSFLAFPLGSVFSLLSDNVFVLSGCINNLYSSVKDMDIECFKSKMCRDMLLAPKLATFYGIEKQILNLEEITSKKLLVPLGCLSCYSDNGCTPLSKTPYCNHGVRQSEVVEKDPKSRKVKTCSGGAFVVDSKRFMIADNLFISPLSLIHGIKNYETNFSDSDIYEKDVCLDKTKALSLLGTMLISKTVLTDVFGANPKSRKGSQ